MTQYRRIQTKGREKDELWKLNDSLNQQNEEERTKKKKNIPTYLDFISN